MRKSSAIFLSLVVTALCFARVSATAQAQAHAKPPTAEPKQQARAAYTRGQTEFAAGHYEIAKAAFDEAFEAVPNPVVLLSIAEAEAKLGATENAIATFKRYLELRTDAPDRADVEAKITTLSATPAQLSLTSEPTGATIDLDGLPTQKTTPTQLDVPAGDHEIGYSLRGYKAGTIQVKAAPGGKQALVLTLEPLEVEPALLQAAASAPALEPEPEPAPAPEPVKAGPPTTALWITGSIGAAGLITGTVLGFLAIKEHSDFESNPTEASADRGERLALFADVGFGVGAMAIVTAAVLYLTYDEAPDATDSDTASLRIAPQFSPSSAAATARLRF